MRRTGCQLKRYIVPKELAAALLLSGEAWRHRKRRIFHFERPENNGDAYYGLYRAIYFHVRAHDYRHHPRAALLEGAVARVAEMPSNTRGKASIGYTRKPAKEYKVNVIIIND